MTTYNNIVTIHWQRQIFTTPSCQRGTRGGDNTRAKYHTGEKWESDKNRNKTQQV